MKLIHLKNLKRECVLVELPDKIRDLGIFKANYGPQIIFTDKFDCGITADLPDGDWKILGKFTDLKEEDFEGLVHEKYWFPINRFKDYNPKSENEKYLYLIPKDSFISAIEAEGWYTENPYAKTLRDAVDKSPGSSYEEKLKEADIYREAQEKVINLSNCYLFVKS